MRATAGRTGSVNVLCRTAWILAVLTAAAGQPCRTLAKDRYDIVVYGGTSAGIAAAVQAVRMGRSVVVIEPTGHLGGLTTSGLGWTDTGDKRVIGGLAREFYRRVKQHYDDPSAWRFQDRARYSRYRPDADAMWTFEPHVAAAIFERLIEEHGIPVFTRERLNRTDGVVKRGARIVSIGMESGWTVHGRVFIDATYEGDLMAAAGVTYTVGRESNDRYGEVLNGVQTKRNTHNHRFIRDVDPYVRPGDPDSGLLPGVHGDPPGQDGQGDRRIQAYCFRMCMSNVPENRVPFRKPEGYREQDYELLLRNFEAGDLRLPLSLGLLPNGKTDTNNNGAVSTDWIGMNYDWPEADYEQRQQIQERHAAYQKGLMWTLAGHPRVPESIREQMAEWGLAADEFTDNDHWPPMLYVREARRMVGVYVMTEHDCRRVRVADDSAGLGSYNMDSHNVQRYVTARGTVQNEGDIQVSPGGAYVISMRSLMPNRAEADNLLVPVCLSASHIAYGSIRMEPVFMILGQSAATAAVLAVSADSAVQEVAYEDLEKRLRADGQVLDLPPGSRPRGVISTAGLDGVVVDDASARLEGHWVTSTSVGPFVEDGYRHEGNGRFGPAAAHFRAPLPAGRYEVRLSWTASPNRATNVPVTIRHAGGTDTVRISQRQPPAEDGLFRSLGIFTFSEDVPAEVTIGNENADGYVVIDAVQFLKR